jgi:hypothetical protein
MSHDLPAITSKDGTKEWYLHGKRHRAGGLPAIEWHNGDNWWYEFGELHREGGLPAIESYGCTSWYIRGTQLPRERALAYMTFCEKMQSLKRIRAQKKLYFWWIQICYDITRDCGKRMAEKNFREYEKLVDNNNNY